jgi:hypothetical protein
MSLARELADAARRDAEEAASDSDSSPMSITSRASFLNEMHGRADSVSLSTSLPRRVISTDSFLCEIHDNPGTQRAAIQEIVEPRRPASYLMRRFEELDEANQLDSRWCCLSCGKRCAEYGHRAAGFAGLDPPGLQKCCEGLQN